MPKQDKRFRDTAVGRLMTEKLPEAIHMIGDVLPDKGVLGIAKNIIDKSTLSPEEKAELNEHIIEYRLELERFEIEDRKNARWREVEMAKVGKNDPLKFISGIIGLGTFLLIVVSIIFGEKFGLDMQENPIIFHLLGVVEGVALTIYNYNFGTSKSSQDKTKIESLK